MERIRILAKRVIQQMLADRRTLVLIVVVPMILLSFVGILINSQGGSLTVGVVNEDTGGGLVNVGDRLTTVLGDFEEFEVKELSAQAAQNQLADGQLDAVITLPTDFTQQVLGSHIIKLAVHYAGSNPMIAERLSKIFERVALQAANNLSAVSSTSNVTLTTQLEATYLYGGAEYDTLDYMAPALVGFFVFFFVFLLTCIAFLRERMAGTLERLQATPIRSAEIILGYMSGFMLFGLLQGAITLLFTIFVLDIHYAGNVWNVFVVEALLVMVSVNLGIFLSTFAQNEFQVLQFMPLIVVSQGLLGGIIWQIEDMPTWLQPISRLMPLTYANQALRDVMIKGSSLLEVWSEVLVLVGFAVLAVALASRTAGRAKI